MITLQTSPPLFRRATDRRRVPPPDVVVQLVKANWTDVRLGEIRITPTHEPDRTRTVVHACVVLGPLLPADVLVELIRLHEPGPAPKAELVVAQLFSGHSYQNGSFAFEATIADEEPCDRGHLAIRVTAAIKLGLSSVLAPVIVPVIPSGIGQSR